MLRIHESMQQLKNEIGKLFNIHSGGNVIIEEYDDSSSTQVVVKVKYPKGFELIGATKIEDIYELVNDKLCDVSMPLGNSSMTQEADGRIQHIFIFPKVVQAKKNYVQITIGSTQKDLGRIALDWKKYLKQNYEDIDCVIELNKRNIDMANKIKESYPDGNCPDCYHPISEDVVDGDECFNCGHIFWDSDDHDADED